MNELLHKRLLQENKDVFKYSKYIFNGNLIGFLFMLSFIFAYYYLQWLQTVTVFQSKLLISVCLIIVTMVIFMQKVILLVKPADIVFLTCREADFKAVFSLTRIRSLLSPIISMMIVNLVILPVFTIHLNYQLLINLIVMQLVVLIIVRIVYEQQFYHQNVLQWWHYSILLSISIVFLLLPIWHKINYVSLFLLLLLMGAILLAKKQKTKALNWEKMIVYEQQRKQKQYQLLALFVDIPQLAIRVHRRKYFDVMIKGLTSKTTNMYYYLFVRSFFRQENTIFLLIRLMLFAMLLMSVFKYDLLILCIGVMASYLVLIQLRTLIKQYDYHLWFQIYPQNNTFKYTAFDRLIRQIMFAVICIITVYSLFILTVKWYVVIYLIVMIVIILWLEKNKKG